VCFSPYYVLTVSVYRAEDKRNTLYQTRLVT